MEGKTGAQRCLVTGANRGLGLELCRQLLAGGGRVIAACRNPGKATALNTLAGEYPGRLRVAPLDVAEPKSHAALARELAAGDTNPSAGDEELLWAIQDASPHVREIVQRFPQRSPGRSRLDTLYYQLDAALR